MEPWVFVFCFVFLQCGREIVPELLRVTLVDLVKVSRSDSACMWVRERNMLYAILVIIMVGLQYNDLSLYLPSSPYQL